MSKKKQINKKNNNRKLQVNNPVKNKIQITNNNLEVISNKKEEKGKKSFIKAKHIIFSLFFFILILSYLFIPNNIPNKISTQQNKLVMPKIPDESNLKLILNFMNNHNYNHEKLDDYLTYYKQYNSPINDTIIIINNNLENFEYNKIMSEFIKSPNFIQENFSRYIAYYNQYNLNINKTILAINNNLDKLNLKLDKTIESFIKQKYYISNNLKRYLNYYKKHKNLTLKEVITRVNSNLDKTFYKDSNKADINNNELILVNKYYYLDNNYTPKNLVNVSSKHGTGKLKKEVYEAFKLMYNDAAKDNLYLYISSPYRSYNRQNVLYNTYVKKDGESKADTYSARPGYSEHQTGLAFDLGTAENNDINEFVESKEFKWMKNNAHKYGFILRYPYGKKYITGYIYEPWHYRYVGIDAATYIYNNNITFEEYYAYFVN